MKAMKPGTGRRIIEALAVLYAPSTPQTKAEADALAREHCARVEAGVPRVERETDDGLFAGVPETSGRCLGSKKTPADGARCFDVVDVDAAGDMAAIHATPLGDPSTFPRLPRGGDEHATRAATERVAAAAAVLTPRGQRVLPRRGARRG